MHKIITTISLAAIVLLAPAIAWANDEADLVLRGGKIVTVDDALPLAEAMAVRDGKILAVGKRQQIDPLIGAGTKVIELSGRIATPGFIEGHGHLVGLGELKMNLDLTACQSWDEVVDAVKLTAREAKPGKWIVGRGWHQGKWREPPSPNVEGYPTHEKLSRAAPDNPVLLMHRVGHMVFANAAAMKLAGVDAATPNPAGGEILKDSGGAPCGAFRENAAGLITRAHQRSLDDRSSAEKRDDLLNAINLAQLECLTNGVTSFQDAGSSFETVNAFKALSQLGMLRVRLWVMLNEDNDALAARMQHYRYVGYGEQHLTVRGVKRMVDGALGTHGAWLLEPYDDLPSSSGLNTASIESIERTAELCRRHGFQLCVHAIGDRANREVLDLFERNFGNGRLGRELRWRIEHAQHLHASDIPRFAELGVIASMQGIHCTSDAPFVPQRLGMRRSEQGAYVWQSLLESGAMVINGTDAPVEPISPIGCFYASVTRKLANGEAFFPKQCMTREQALRSYTLDAAYAAFEDRQKGSLTPGKLADIAVISRDIMTIPEEEIPAARVDMTIVGGQVLYEREAEAESAGTR